MSNAKEWTDEQIERAVGAADFRHYEEDKVEELMRQVRDDIRAEADGVMASSIRQAHELMIAKLDEWRQREIDLLVDCIDFVMSYGIGDEDGYRARYRELVGHEYGEDREDE